jgi:transglutaminase-like putative cysteine protease
VSRAAVSLRPALGPPQARLAGFAAAALFVAVEWGGLLLPRAPVVAPLALAVALATGLVLLARAPDRLRRPGAIALALLAVPAALLVAGVGLADLRPRGWSGLLAGLVEGLDAVPEIRAPYAGGQEWARTVVALGTALGLPAAAALAFWPVAGPRPLALGTVRRLAAVGVLVVLYATVTVNLGGAGQFVRGTLLFLALAAFLWLERLPGADLPAAGALAALAAVGGLLLAPSLDRGGPWIDYGALAGDLQAQRGDVFSWSHEYGTLDWPRDGTELLRVRARDGAYWKATNLDTFDGLRWVPTNWNLPDLQRSVPQQPRWRQQIKVTVRDLSSPYAIGAGTTLAIRQAPSAAYPGDSPGTWRMRRPLRRGQDYVADVYTPRPSTRELRASGTAYPGVAVNFTQIALPQDDPARVRAIVRRYGAAAGTRLPREVVSFGLWGAPQPLQAYDFYRRRTTRGAAAEAILRRSVYSGTWRLAQRLRARARTPYEYVQDVKDFLLGGGFGYSEAPPVRPIPLESFLTRDRLGYCQHFSGAMALLLRMGGVPARVAAGFSPGQQEKGQWVVRDLDAHSWVEVFFPGIGWVTVDPTPPAGPASSQADPIRPPRGPLSDAPAFPGDPAGSRFTGGTSPTGTPAGGGASGWLLVAAGAGALALGGGVGLVGLRLGRRAGIRVAGGTTLRGLERAFRGSPGALAYLRALSAARYGAGPPPGPEGRRALRRALARRSGRLRAMWALPPRLGRW